MGERRQIVAMREQGESFRAIAEVYERAIQLKQAHPKWGAGLIWVELAEEFDDEYLPSQLTLQQDHLCATYVEVHFDDVTEHWLICDEFSKERRRQPAKKLSYELISKLRLAKRRNPAKAMAL